MKKNVGLNVALIALLSVIVIAAFYISAQKTRDDIRDTSKRQLQMIALDLESILEKHDTLPFALVFDPDIVQVLLDPNNKIALNRLNHTLQSIQRQARVTAIFLINRNGIGVASSNWDLPAGQSFVGIDVRFRPYFRDPVAGNPGRFYGIGTTTNEPGYYISRPVFQESVPSPTSVPIGVVAVKISLAEFEHTWASSEDPISLIDKNGVIFLTNHTAWKYHTISAPDNGVQEQLDATLQYSKKTILPIPGAAQLRRSGLGDPIVQAIDRMGWKLVVFPSESRAIHSGWVAAIGATLLFAIIGSLLWAAHQRRRRLEEGKVSRKALRLAAEELEKRIEQRTQDLLLANQHIEEKFLKLRATEHLLRTTQNELVQAGKLTILGQMAAGVTHELNQPLSAILAFADNAVTFLNREQPIKARENLSYISAAAQRMGAIIAQLKGFVGKTNNFLVPVNLADSIRTSILLLQNDFTRNDTQLIIDVQEEVSVIGDNVRIEQVLINLLRNALDATVECGVREVTVTLSRNAHEAVISIRDSGTGIAQEIVGNLFEPFFTTKPSGKGLGLGLAISSSIIQAMNGHLQAKNHAAGGAEFILTLPVQDESRSQGETLAQE